MQYTRQRLIEYLQANPMASAQTMSRSLQVTAANIRHHLKLLLGQGLVEMIGQEPARGRGRPTKLYGLTPQATQHNLAGLASAALQICLGTPFTTDQLVTLVDHLIGDLEEISPNPIQRLNQVMTKLNQWHYHARWEASAAGPRLILGHCPYLPILPDHPELCQMDTLLLSKLVDLPVEQISKLERNPGGMPHCVFQTTRELNVNR
jgi:predicted ArsR family transcriptional regulator